MGGQDFVRNGARRRAGMGWVRTINIPPFNFFFPHQTSVERLGDHLGEVDVGRGDRVRPPLQVPSGRELAPIHLGGGGGEDGR